MLRLASPRLQQRRRDELRSGATDDGPWRPRCSQGFDEVSVIIVDDRVPPLHFLLALPPVLNETHRQGSARAEVRLDTAALTQPPAGRTGPSQRAAALLLLFCLPMTNNKIPTTPSHVGNEGGGEMRARDGVNSALCQKLFAVPVRHAVDVFRVVGVIVDVTDVRRRRCPARFRLPAQTRAGAGAVGRRSTQGAPAALTRGSCW